jgi:cytochrome oxidase assembly protein ShyY1
MIPRIISKRPYITLATLITVAICLTFIHSKENAIKKNRAVHELFLKNSTLPILTALPLPIEYGKDAYQEMIYRKVSLHGSFLDHHEIYLENRIPENSELRATKKSSGFHIMMPLLLDSGQIVWVNRGWTARDPSDRQKIPDPPQNHGKQWVKGYINLGSKDILGMPSESAHLINGHVIALNFYMHDDKTQLPNQEVYPFTITQTDTSTDDLIRPEENFYYTPDYSFDLRSWWITLFVAVIFWFISGLAYIRQNRSNSPLN